MVSKPLLTLSLSQHIAETKAKYLAAFQSGDIVIAKQETRDWVIASFAGIEKYADGLDAAVEFNQATFHGVNSWRLPALFARVREAFDELPDAA